MAIRNEITKHINSNFLPDTVYEYTIWGTQGGKKTVFTYNAYGNPETANLFLEDTAGVWAITPYTTHYYYYEEYQDMSKASDAVYANGVDIYPNPATDYISLQIEKPGISN